MMICPGNYRRASSEPVHGMVRVTHTRARAYMEQKGRLQFAKQTIYLATKLEPSGLLFVACGPLFVKFGQIIRTINHVSVVPVGRVCGYF